MRLALDGSGARQMRIPASWRLQLALAADLPLFRTDVARHTAVRDLRAAVAAHARVPPDAVALCAPHTLPRDASMAAAQATGTIVPSAAECVLELDQDDATAEAIRLFAWRHRLRVVLRQRSALSASAAAASPDHTVLQLD